MAIQALSPSAFRSKSLYFIDLAMVGTGSNAQSSFNRPNVICKPGFHCWRNSQRLVNPAKVVMHEVQRNRMSMVLKFLREPAGQRGKLAHRHSHGQILALNVARADVRRVPASSRNRVDSTVRANISRRCSAENLGVVVAACNCRSHCRSKAGTRIPSCLTAIGCTNTRRSPIIRPVKNAPAGTARNCPVAERFCAIAAPASRHGSTV